MRIAVIGAGNIIPFHLKALKHSGFEISHLGASLDSSRARKVCADFKIPNILVNSEDLLAHHKEFDCILLAPRSDLLFEYLKLFKNLEKPILIEKPIFVDSEQIQEVQSLENLSHMVMVAYNRRFYSSIQAFSQVIEEEKVGSFNMEIPEFSHIDFVTREQIPNILINNTVHMLDLLKYLFKLNLSDLKIEFFEKSNSIFQINLVHKGENIAGVANITFGIPGNYSINFKTFGHLYQVKPLEMYKDFSETIISDPNEEIPIRIYQPKSLVNINDFPENPLDKNFKPGFFKQAMAFRQFVSTGVVPKEAARISDALDVSRFVFKVIDKLKYD